MKRTERNKFNRNKILIVNDFDNNLFLKFAKMSVQKYLNIQKEKFAQNDYLYPSRNPTYSSPIKSEIVNKKLQENNKIQSQQAYKPSNSTYLGSYN